MLNRANLNWSAKALCNQVEKGRVVFDSVVQRGFVWDEARMSLLIHSMIDGYPIPPLYFSKENDVYSALDGKQRSNAICMFLKNAYRLSSNTPFVVDEDGNEIDIAGKFFNDLPEAIADKIKDYTLLIYYFDEITDEEIAELFFRINNGKPLSANDLTRVRAKSMAEYSELAQHEMIDVATTDKSKNARNNESIAMQSYAIVVDDEPDFETKKFRAWLEVEEATEENLQKVKNALNLVYELYSQLSSENAEDKKLMRKLRMKTHLVSAVYLADYALENNIEQHEFNNALKTFFGSTKASTSALYNQACGASSAKGSSIATRKEEILKALVK